MNVLNIIKKMKTIDPHEKIKNSKIAKKLFAKETLEMLKLYDDALTQAKGFENVPAMQEMLQDIAIKANEMIDNEIPKIKEGLKSDADKKTEKKIKTAQSAKIMEEIANTADYLAECRAKLKEHNRLKREAEGKTKPIKRRLTTRLKEGMKKIVNMMPKAVKSDTEKIYQTECIIKRTLSELKKVWGMNKIEGIEASLKEQFEGLKEKAKPNKTT